MGRNNSTVFKDNRAGSETNSASISKILKRSVPEPVSESVISVKKPKLSVAESNSKKSRGQDIYTDSSSSSESDSEKNSVKKSERSVSDGNSDSDSDSDSDSSESDSSQESKPAPAAEQKPVNNSVTKVNPIVVEERYEEPPGKSSGSDSYHSDTEEEDKKRRRKQKELLKQQLSKKGRRGSPRKLEQIAVKEVEEDGAADDEEVAEPQANSDDVPDWPESDVLELIRRMEVQIPEGDTQKFDSRAARLDWEKIAFGDYSSQDCLTTWNQISKRIRRFRKLIEVLQDAKEWAKKPWTNFYRGSKKNRHPDMPSKPPSAYVTYYLEHKDKVVEMNKGADLMQISKILAEMYKNLSDEEREVYVQKAAREKKIFAEKIADFYKKHPEYEPVTQSKTSKELVKGPKKPHPPFKLFFLEELKNVAVKDRKLAEEAARKKWKRLGDSKKAEWIKMSLEDLKRYEREIKAYKEKNPEYSTPNCNKNLLNKEEKLILERLSGKPVKPPNSAYSLFSRYMLQSNPEVKNIVPKLRMAEVSRQWKELPTQEKRKYELQVKELQGEYKQNLQKYLKSLTPEERQREVEATKKASSKKKVKSSGKVLKNTESNAKDEMEVSRLSISTSEPKPPPLRVYDLFLEKFLSERPSGVSEETRLKQAPEYWEKLPESKKEALQEELAVLKQKYVTELGKFLQNLSAENLKALILKRAKMQGEQVQTRRLDFTLSDSNDESDDDKGESSSEGSDSDETDSEKSKKNGSESGRSKPSSSEDSDG